MDDFDLILQNGINFGRGGDRPKAEDKVKNKVLAMCILPLSWAEKWHRLDQEVLEEIVVVRGSFQVPYSLPSQK